MYVTFLFPSGSDSHLLTVFGSSVIGHIYCKNSFLVLGSVGGAKGSSGVTKAGCSGAKAVGSAGGTTRCFNEFLRAVVARKAVRCGAGGKRGCFKKLLGSAGGTTRGCWKAADLTSSSFVTEDGGAGGGGTTRSCCWKAADLTCSFVMKDVGAGTICGCFPEPSSSAGLSGASPWVQP